MFSLDIDIGEIARELILPKNLSDVIVEACVDTVKDAVYYNWINAANLSLKSTRNDYINNLVITSPDKFSRVITLKGAFNNMLENGTGPRDLKEIFKLSKKVKYNKKGQWYLTIPFRFGTPGIVGENSAFTGVMPSSVYRAVQANPKGLSQSKVPSPYDAPRTRERIVIPDSNIDIAAYTNKNSIYAGIRKNVGVYDVATRQVTYNSFRRVGANSDPNSWITKGIQAYNLLGKALNNTDIRTISENKVDEILSSLGYSNH